MRLLLLPAAVFAFALPAHADPAPRAPAAAPPAATTSAPTRHADATAMHTDDCARARAHHRTCVLDMGNDTITGEAPTGGGSRVRVIQPVKEASLIHLRREFIVQMLETAEDL
jgi:hypothetical protein